MISVIVYGRNDSYGYNLHKRVALSLNCIAEVLTSDDDEIVFVDCNTAETFPTLPEALGDTLTDTAKRRLRVFRVRPECFERHRNGSRFSLLESFSRNVGIRRSNPRNRWVLSTNTDMIFMPRKAGGSLTSICAALPDGFYELPRFELPVSLWEGFDRKDPAAAFAEIEAWRRRLPLHEVVNALPFVLYDGPGDFQLMLRRHIFEIDGFPEEMVHGWHVDSNIAKRLWLHNGTTGSVIDELFGYHCEHTRDAGVAHASGGLQNDADKWVFSVETPYLPGQRESWGAPDEVIEEVSLAGAGRGGWLAELARVLPPPQTPYIESWARPEDYNTGLLYDDGRALVHLADILQHARPGASVAYVGTKQALCARIAAMVGQRPPARLLYAEATLEGVGPVAAAEPCSIERIAESADIVVFDVGVDAGASRREAPARTPVGGNPVGGNPVGGNRADPSERLMLCADRWISLEHERLRRSKAEVPRTVVVLGSQNTRFETFFIRNFSLKLTPFACHLRHGIVKPPRIEPGSQGGDASQVQPDRAAAFAASLSEYDRTHLSRMVEGLKAAEDIPTFLRNNAAVLHPNVWRYFELQLPDMDDKVRLARAVRDLSNASLMRRKWELPLPDARPPSDRISATCSSLDWDVAEWRASARLVLEEEFIEDYCLRHRNHWENTHLFHGLSKLGALGRDARILYLTGRDDPVCWTIAKSVSVIDVVDLGYQGDPADPALQKWAQRGLHRQAVNLRLFPGKALGWLLGNNRYDAVVLSQGMVNSLTCADGKADDFVRLFKAVTPGGIVGVITDVVLKGKFPPSLDVAFFSADSEVGSRWRRMVGLEQIGSLSAAIDDETLQGCVTPATMNSQRPFFVVDADRALITSAVVFHRVVGAGAPIPPSPAAGAM